MIKLETIIIIMICIIVVLTITNGVIADKTKNKRCHDMHYEECLACHSHNLTYALCSGFCIEPRQEDNEIFCSFSPEEGCSKIPKECVV